MTTTLTMTFVCDKCKWEFDPMKPELLCPKCIIKDKWINIKDRIPDKLLKVLIYVPSYDKFFQDIFVACLCDQCNCDEWHLLNDNFTNEIITIKYKEVTHWMTLPELPDKESE